MRFHSTVSSPTLRITSLAALAIAACSSILAQTPIVTAELEAPKIEIHGNSLKFTIAGSVPGRRYQLQASETLAAGNWVDLGDAVTGDGNAMVVTTGHFPGLPRRYYRLVLDGTPVAPAGLALIPSGTFTMGASTFAELSNTEGAGDVSAEGPSHTVGVDSFYLQKGEVTTAEWNEVWIWAAAHGYTDLEASDSADSDAPVLMATWFDVIRWCNARSEKEGLVPVYTLAGAVMRTGTGTPTPNWSASGYRLPTEAEWEKAARGGLIGKRYPWGDSIDSSLANYRPHGGDGGPVPVGSYAPNSYDLHDMAGNVWEWCWDRYDAVYYAASPASNPRGPVSGTSRCMRGGCWYDEFDSRLRCANRGHDDPTERFDDVGFRTARSLAP